MTIYIWKTIQKILKRNLLS